MNKEPPWFTCLACGPPALLIIIAVFQGEWAAASVLFILVAPVAGALIFTLHSHKGVTKWLDRTEMRLFSAQDRLDALRKSKPVPAAEPAPTVAPPPKPAPTPKPSPAPTPSLGDLEKPLVASRANTDPGAVFAQEMAAPAVETDDGPKVRFLPGKGNKAEPRKLLTHMLPPAVNKALKQSGFNVVTSSGPDVSAEYLFEVSNKERRVLVGSISDLLILDHRGDAHAGILYVTPGTKAAEIIGACRALWAKGGAR